MGHGCVYVPHELIHELASGAQLPLTMLDLYSHPPKLAPP